MGLTTGFAVMCVAYWKKVKCVCVCRGSNILNPVSMGRSSTLSKTNKQTNIELWFSYLNAAGSSQFRRGFLLRPARRSLWWIILCPLACQSSKMKAFVPLACGGCSTHVLWLDSPLSTTTLCFQAGLVLVSFFSSLLAGIRGLQRPPSQHFIIFINMWLEK